MVWVTQLVVHTDHRRRKIATTMLQEVRNVLDGTIECLGVASSHPGACMALAISLSGCLIVSSFHNPSAVRSALTLSVVSPLRGGNHT